MTKQVDIYLDNNHVLSLENQDEDIANELGAGLANRTNEVIHLQRDDSDILVPRPRILYIHVSEED